MLHSFRESMEFRIGDFRVTVIPSVHSKAHWYNNDLGKTIDAPLVQPARKKAFREGGSYDFFIFHKGRKYLIRPSYNYLEGQLDGYKADVLFLGIAGISKDTEARRERAAWCSCRLRGRSFEGAYSDNKKQNTCLHF
jgi:hypothetical protein